MTTKISEKNKVILFIVLYVLFMAVGKIILNPLPPDSLVRAYVKLPLYLFLGIFGIILFRNDFKDGFIQWKEHPVKNALFVVGLFIANVVLCNIASIPGQLIYGDAVSMNDTNIEGIIGSVSPVLIILTMGIFGPIAEELVFRNILITKASSRVNTVLCILLSSVLFMLIHIHAFTLQEIMLNLDKFTTGIIFGTSLVLTKNLTVPVSVHVMNNTFGLALIILADLLQK